MGCEVFRLCIQLFMAKDFDGVLFRLLWHEIYQHQWHKVRNSYRTFDWYEENGSLFRRIWAGFSLCFLRNCECKTIWDMNYVCRNKKRWIQFSLTENQGEQPYSLHLTGHLLFMYCLYRIHKHSSWGCANKIFDAILFGRLCKLEMRSKDYIQ